MSEVEDTRKRRVADGVETAREHLVADGVENSRERRARDIKKRVKYHPPQTADQRLAHSTVGARCKDLMLELSALCPESRELSLALTKVEEARMWFNAALAVHNNAVE